MFFSDVMELPKNVTELRLMIFFLVLNRKCIRYSYRLCRQSRPGILQSRAATLLVLRLNILFLDFSCATDRITPGFLDFRMSPYNSIVASISKFRNLKIAHTVNVCPVPRTLFVISVSGL